MKKLSLEQMEVVEGGRMSQSFWCSQVLGVASVPLTIALGAVSMGAGVIVGLAWNFGASYACEKGYRNK